MSWSLKKKNIIALSSTEAKYIAQTHAAKEALWMRAFIEEIWGTTKTPMTINCDNQGVIALAKDNKFHSHTKHINLQYHFIHEAVEDSKISVNYIPTDQNVSDVLTKLLTKLKFQGFVEMLGLGGLEKWEPKEGGLRRIHFELNQDDNRIPLSFNVPPDNGKQLFIVTWCWPIPSTKMKSHELEGECWIYPSIAPSFIVIF